MGRLAALAFGGALLLSLGGCPISGDDVLTATVQAALNAATTSLVDTLSTYLAGN
jgi:hypothetical protein